MAQPIVLIDNGLYNCPERQLEFNLSADITGRPANSAFIISGENGAGKTSFLELVVIPHLLKKREFPLYIGSDAEFLLSATLAWIAINQLAKGTIYDRPSTANDPITRYIAALSPMYPGTVAALIDDFTGNMDALLESIKQLLPALIPIVVSHDVEQTRKQMERYYDDINVIMFRREGRKCYIDFL